MKTKHGDEYGMCILEDNKKCNECGECDRCDLDPTKICDNCGACISEYNTNEKGFVEIPIDKIDMTAGEPSLDDFYKMYGLDDDEDEEK